MAHWERLFSHLGFNYPLFVVHVIGPGAIYSSSAGRAFGSYGRFIGISLLWCSLEAHGIANAFINFLFHLSPFQSLLLSLFLFCISSLVSYSATADVHDVYELMRALSLIKV